MSVVKEWINIDNYKLYLQYSQWQYATSFFKQSKKKQWKSECLMLSKGIGWYINEYKYSSKYNIRNP